MKKTNYIHYLFSLFGVYKKKLSFIALVMLVDTVLRLTQPYFYKLLVDTLTNGIVAKGFSDQQSQFMLMVVGSWFVVSVLNNLLHGQGMYMVWQLGNYVSEKVALDGFQRLLRLDYHQHTQKSSSQYTKIMDDADTAVWEMTNWWLNRFFPASLGFVGMLIVAFSVSWKMTLISLIIIPPGLAIIFFMLARYSKRQRKVNKLWLKRTEHMSDQLANIITYKLNQDEEFFSDRHQALVEKALSAQLAMNKKWRLLDIINPDVIARFLVMGAGVFFVKDGSITLGTLFMFMGLLNEILVPLNLLGDILPQYSRKARHIEKFLKLMDQEDKILDPEKPLELKKVKGEIEFKNVSFSYPGSGDDGFSLRNVSFVIHPGETVAMVGHSGAGKSTIMGLITRLADPTEGEILLDGVNIKNFRQSDLRAHMAAVLQEHSMYNESIAHNIAYGKHGAKPEEIIEAAKMAAADDFINKIPKGYDSLIGERGVRLSGGEKQRIAIARAILKNPQIVILDEPTSALDSITEARVQKGLDVLIQGRSCLVIAHRLSTVKSADKILVLRGGELIAAAPHAELLKTCEVYKEMVELQVGGFLADE